MSEFDGRITELFGERCPDHEPSCACCVVWDMRDRIEAQAKEIAELKAALAWQPIETAPKGETEFLVWNAEWRCVTQFNGVVFWQAKMGEGPTAFMQPEVMHCTHWMPISAPPSP